VPSPGSPPSPGSSPSPGSCSPSAACAALLPPAISGGTTILSPGEPRLGLSSGCPSPAPGLPGAAISLMAGS